MKKNTIRVGAMLALTAFLFGSTVSVTGSSPEISAAKKAPKIALSRTKVTLETGKSVTLTLKNVPAKNKKKVKWSTADKKTATVKAKKNPRKAMVTAVSGGAVTITAKYKKKTYKCRVTCTEPEAEPAVEPTAESTAEPTASPALSYTQITQSKAREMMRRDDGHVIVDVRRLSEYLEKHIRDAILIPNETITTERPEKLPDLDQIILVYCRSGRRSKEAAQKLGDMGYTNVYEFGGIQTWTGPFA